MPCGIGGALPVLWLLMKAGLKNTELCPPSLTPAGDGWEAGQRWFGFCVLIAFILY